MVLCGCGPLKLSAFRAAVPALVPATSVARWQLVFPGRGLGTRVGLEVHLELELLNFFLAPLFERLGFSLWAAVIV